MPQPVDIAAQFEPIHLRALPQFPREVRRWLIEFRKLDHLKLRITRDAAALKIADPPRLENPGALSRLPISALGIHAAVQRKILWVQLEDAQATKEDAVGIEELIIIDL